MREQDTDGWQRGTLGELLPIKYGKSMPEKARDPNGVYPVYGSSGRVGVHSSALTKGPALIVGRKGTVGAVYYSNEPCWPIDTVYYTEAETRQNLRYYKYLLDSLHLERLDKSTAVPGLSRDDYNAVEVTVAPPTDQERIVAEIEKQFSRLDEAGDNLKHILGKLKRYRVSVLKFLYSGGTMGKELPPAWKWTTIGEQFRVEVGATPSRKHSDYWGGSIPWVSSGEVQFRRVKQTEETISEKGLRNSSTKLNPAGSVLLAMIGQGRTRGQAAILDIEAANNQNCAAIWVSKTETPPEFVYYWFMSQYEATRRVGSGNNQQALNKSLVQRLPMPWPKSIVEQRRLVGQVEERLQAVEAIEAQVHANLARSRYLRRTLLQRAFVQRAEAGL